MLLASLPAVSLVEPLLCASLSADPESYVEEPAPANQSAPVPTHASDVRATAPLHGAGDGQFALQRAFDTVIVLVAVVVFAIPAVIIAALVKLTSPGPVLFRQLRVGRHGELFDVYKFRTMRDGTHLEVLDDDDARRAYHANDFKLPDDDHRITRIGRLLCRTSLDELPQLVNVLKGDMSIVGVRPLLAEELALRPEHDQVLYRTMRPGMTGLWQVEDRSTVQKEDRLHLDRRYLENWSVWGNVKIIARTPGARLRIHHAH